MEPSDHEGGMVRAHRGREGGDRVGELVITVRYDSVLVNEKVQDRC